MTEKSSDGVNSEQCECTLTVYGVAHSLLLNIAAEVQRARSKFPGTEHLTVALMEEVGELAKAHLKNDKGNIREEAIQVAAMAIRILEEGDASFASWGGEDE